MIEVMIDSVRVNLMSPQRLVILREVGSDRYLPIWVGQYEAEMITVGLQEVEVSRPLTHDLMKNVFATFNAKIKRIEIISLKEDIFYGNIIAEVNGKEISVDSRPSDAIALAVRAHAPILVDESVMKNAGIMPEVDMKSSASASASSSGKTRPIAPVGDVSSERLSVFEDFVDKLDFNKLDDKDKPEDNSEDDKPDKPSKPKKQ
ncbi:MAG: bifunctional nuclease family protein [Anaerolineales bacterium]